jgi:hypothetical protein
MSRTPEPLSIQSQDTSTSTLVEQNDLLDTLYETALSTIDSLVEFYSTDPESPEARDTYTKVIKQLRTNQLPLAEQCSQIQLLERSFHASYQKKLKEIELLNGSSFDQMSKTNKVLFEHRMKTVEVQSLEKSLGSLKPIKLQDEELSLEMNKEQMLKILDIERKRRGSLSFRNEKILEPEIKRLTTQYELWGKRDNELKRYLVDDLEVMNKKIQMVKKSND